MCIRDRIYTNVDMVYTNVDMIYTNVDNIYTNVDMIYTNVDVSYLHLCIRKPPPPPHDIISFREVIVLKRKSINLGGGRRQLNIQYARTWVVSSFLLK